MASQQNKEFIHEHALKVFGSLKRQFQQKQCLDLTIVTSKDNNEIQAHRSILVACSKYFAQKCSLNSHQQRIVLKDISGNIVEALVGFCYTGRIQINMDNVKELLQATVKLHLKDVQHKCLKYLTVQMAIQPEICFFVQSLDVLRKCDRLNEMANFYSVNYFSKIKNSEFFLQLSIDKVIKVLSDNSLSVKREDEVFNAAMAWMNYSAERKSSLFDLLKCIRYIDIDEATFNGPIRLAFRSISCTRFYNHILRKRTDTSDSYRSLSRFNISSRLVPRTQLLATINAGNDLAIKRYCFATKQWIYTGLVKLHKSIFVDGRSSFIDTTNNKICFLLSSYDAFHVTCINLEALSVDTDTRHTIKMNNNADCSPILLKMKNETYVFVCCCHYETWNTWDTFQEDAPFKVERLPSPIHDAAAVEFMDCIYFIRIKTNQVQCFNPEQNTWSTIQSMHLVYDEPRAAAYNGLLYVISADGLCNRTTGECYDPKSKKWTMIRPIDDHLDFMSISFVAVEDGLICSGFSHVRKCFVQMKYHPETNIWTNFGSINRHEHYNVNLYAIVN